MTKSFKVRDLYLLLLVFTIFFIYYKTIFSDFVDWSDYIFVINNNSIKAISFFNFKTIFFTFNSSIYQPVVDLFYAFELFFFGLNSTIFHFDSLIIHIINVLLFFILLDQISTKTIFPNKPLLLLVGALIFGLHPVNAESVSWISARRVLICTFFYLSSLIFYFKFLSLQKKNFYYLSLVSFLLSAFSFWQGILLPFVLIFIEKYLKGENPKIKFINKIPYITISFLVLIINYRAFNFVFNDVSPRTSYTFFAKCILCFNAIVHYILSLLLPIKLSAFYPFPSELKIDLLGIFIIVTIIVLLKLLCKREERKILFFGALILITNQLLVLPYHNYLLTPTSDYLSYMPSLGFGIIIFSILINNSYLRSQIYISSFIILSLITFYIIIDKKRVSVWYNSLTLWDDANKKFPQTEFILKRKDSALRNILNKYEFNDRKSESQIFFPQTIKDFGNIIGNKVVTSNLSFSNIGKSPLIIYDVIPSCGCTVVSWPREPISSNDSSKISFSYDPKNQKGIFSKTILIKSNSIRPEQLLIIKGEVVSEE